MVNHATILPCDSAFIDRIANLTATAIELVEIFQWKTEDESRQLSADQLDHAGQEVGDILMYLLLMCSELGIDMEQALLAKLADNERRFAR